MELLQENPKLALEQIFVPGRVVDVLPRRTEVFTEKQVRHAMVLGIKDEDLVLSLPDPPLASPLVGQALEITFLAQGAQSPARYGYFTLILDTLEQTQAREGFDHSGVIVLFPHDEDIIPTTLRNEKRYRVHGRSQISIKVKGLGGLSLEDISLKGLRFRYMTCNRHVKQGESLELLLQIHKYDHPLKGRVVESSKDPDGVQVRMELDSLPLDLWSGLLQLLHDLDKNGKVATL